MHQLNTILLCICFRGSLLLLHQQLYLSIWAPQIQQGLRKASNHTEPFWHYNNGTQKLSKLETLPKKSWIMFESWSQIENSWYLWKTLEFWKNAADWSLALTSVGVQTTKYETETGPDFQVPRQDHDFYSPRPRRDQDKQKNFWDWSRDRFSLL